MWVSRTHVAPKVGHTCCTPHHYYYHTHKWEQPRETTKVRETVEASNNQQKQTKLRKQTLAPLCSFCPSLFFLPLCSFCPRVNQPGRPSKRQEVDQAAMPQKVHPRPTYFKAACTTAARGSGLKRTWEKMPPSHTKRAAPAGRTCHATCPSFPAFHRLASASSFCLTGLPASATLSHTTIPTIPYTHATRTD